MADFASTSDVEALWLPLEDDDIALCTRLLGFASAIIRNRFPDVDNRIATGKLEGTLVRDITASMVRRSMSTRDQTLTVGVGNLDTPPAEGQPFTLVGLTPEEVEMLTPRQVGRVRSIQLHGGMVPR